MWKKSANWESFSHCCLSRLPLRRHALTYPDDVSAAKLRCFIWFLSPSFYKWKDWSHSEVTRTRSSWKGTGRVRAGNSSSSVRWSLLSPGCVCLIILIMKKKKNLPGQLLLWFTTSYWLFGQEGLSGQNLRITLTGNLWPSLNSRLCCFSFEWEEQGHSGPLSEGLGDSRPWTHQPLCVHLTQNLFFSNQGSVFATEDLLWLEV